MNNAFKGTFVNRAMLFNEDYLKLHSQSFKEFQVSPGTCLLPCKLTLIDLKLYSYHTPVSILNIFFNSKIQNWKVTARNHFENLVIRVVYTKNVLKK